MTTYRRGEALKGLLLNHAWPSFIVRILFAFRLATLSTTPLGQRTSIESIFVRFSRPEVQPQIVLRKITAAAVRPRQPDLRSPAATSDPRADAVAIAFRPDSF